MKTQAVFTVMLLATQVEKVKADCYAEEGDTDPIADCTCHESCATCGYDEYGPEADTDCITCVEADGVELIPYWDDGTGYCAVPGPNNCLDAVGDETPIEDCQCHHTCGTACGYSF